MTVLAWLDFAILFYCVVCASFLLVFLLTRLALVRSGRDCVIRPQVTLRGLMGRKISNIINTYTRTADYRPINSPPCLSPTKRFRRQRQNRQD